MDLEDPIPLSHLHVPSINQRISHVMVKNIFWEHFAIFPSKYIDIVPENTRRVLQPAFSPNKISVSNLSPTIHILVVGMLNLPPEKAKRSINYTLCCLRICFICKSALKMTEIAYFCCKKSIRKVEGFPTTIGSFSVVPQIAATMHPAPELKIRNVKLNIRLL